MRGPSCIDLPTAQHDRGANNIQVVSLTPEIQWLWQPTFPIE
jgi:hypothetical protein